MKWEKWMFLFFLILLLPTLPQELRKYQDMRVLDSKIVGNGEEKAMIYFLQSKEDRAVAIYDLECDDDGCRDGTLKRFYLKDQKGSEARKIWPIKME